MEKVTTKDGSVTFYSKEYDENYHSISGAVEESVKKYIKPCQIENLAKKGKLSILDIGFGLGYNAITAIDYAEAANPNAEIKIVSFEKDKLLVEELKTLDTELKHYDIIKKLEFDPLTSSYRYEVKNIFLEIRIGNAEERIKKLIGKFDAVFLDPFSPKKNPELWTEDFFSEIKKRLNKDAILATYSCARVVRDNLKAAGFTVKDGPVVGRRAPSTLAFLV